MTVATEVHPSGFRSWRGVARLCRLDLRRFRVPIAVVVALELLRGGLAEWVLHAGPLLPGWAFSGASAPLEFQALDLALWLATALTTALLVQADHPADDQGFLRNRPIGGASIAMAKLVTLATLTWVVPLLTTAARLVAYGAPAASIGASAVQFGVIGGAVVVPAWTLALATRTLPRFLAGAAGIAMLWYLAIVAIVSTGPRGPFSEGLIFRVANRQMLNTFAPPLTDWQWVDSQGWLAGLCLTILAAALLAGYYRTRRAIASGLAAAALVAAPAGFPPPAPLTATPDLAAQARDVRLPSLHIPNLELMAQIRVHGEGIIVFGDVLLPSLPVNVSVERQLAGVHVTAPGIDLRAGGLPLRADDPDRASAAAARAPGPAGPREADSEMLFELPSREIERLRAQRVGVDSAIDLEFTRHVLVADLPVRPGTAFRGDGYLVELLSVDVLEPRVTYVRYRFSRFPTLGRPQANLMAFIRRADGRVERTQPGLRPAFDPDFPRAAQVGWAHGRTWAGHGYVRVLDLDAGPHEPRLRLVESRPAGRTRVPFAARGVPVLERKPRPASPMMPVWLGRGGA